MSFKSGRTERKGGTQGRVEELVVRVESVAYGGAGVARSEGRVVFVPFVLPGETVRVRVVKARKNYCEAELIEVLEASPERVAPPCGVFGQCGGCAYQHVRYATQLEWKRAQVRDLLERVGRLGAVAVEPVACSMSSMFYRNRIRVHVRGGKVGFFGRRAASFVEVSQCLIAEEPVNRRLRDLIRARPADGDYTLSSRQGVRFFEQTNDAAAQELVRVVRGHLGRENTLLVDAYCGAGFFAKQLGEDFERVVGIESHSGAVGEARRLASPAQKYLCGDVAFLLGSVLEGAPPVQTTVLLDPPASGLAPQVLEILQNFSPGRIVYVSCDPATMARDVGVLVRGGYVLEKVTPVEMFPQTADIEVVVSLRSKEG